MKLIASLFSLFVVVLANAQERECGTRLRSPLVHHDTLMPLFNKINFTTPYPIRIFFHVVADNNGGNRAAQDTTLLRQVNNMAAFYGSQNICFIVVGIEQINNTALQNMDADNEEGDLAPYLIPDCIDIFVHTSLFDSKGSLAGNAYDIPNDYLSVVGSAMESSSNISTLPHEMGHCFGLFHTFRHRVDNNNNNVFEHRARTGACSNCETEGDLLCDTEADFEAGESSIDSACQYIGNDIYDECNDLLLMAPTNIMTYGRKSCRDHFTNGQGSRMRSFLTSTASLIDCIAEDNLVLSNNQVINSGTRVYAARDQVLITATDLTLSGSIKASFSAKGIVIPPGVTFSPTTSGAYVSVRPGSLCQ